uniref:Uncharacterized protein n=1 Tax=Solanum tuberosum TaxID=4113 RepID=M1CJZ5_SOLTU
MANHDKDKKLNIMRGFFFWLEVKAIPYHILTSMNVPFFSVFNVLLAVTMHVNLLSLIP